MKKIAVFQHVPYEILGTLNPLLRDAGFRIRYVNYGRKPYPTVNIDRYDGLIVLGGPMGVYQTEEHPHLSQEIEHIQKAISQNKPVFGVCLGAQLIAAALGAKVYKSEVKEIGWYDIKLTEAGKTDLLLRNFRETQKIMQWHGDTFDLPSGAELLAESDHCPQAFRYKKKVYGFQFHLESDEHMISRWLRIPIYESEVKNSNGQFSIEQIRTETAKYVEFQKHLAKKTFQQYIELFGSKIRRKPVSGKRTL